MLFTPQLRRGRSSKFHKPWTGPFVVDRHPRPPGVTYSIRDEKTGKVVLAHRNRLKKIVSNDKRPDILYVDDVQGEDFRQEGEGVVAEQPQNDADDDVVVGVAQYQQVEQVAMQEHVPVPVVMQPAQVDVAAAGVGDGPRRSTRQHRPPDRLADDYTARLLQPAGRGGKRK